MQLLAFAHQILRSMKHLGCLCSRVLQIGVYTYFLVTVCVVTVQLKTLTQPASRLLMSSLSLFVDTYPRSLIPSIIVPVVSSESCGTFQADVVTKLIRTVLISDHYAPLLRSQSFDFTRAVVLNEVVTVESNMTAPECRPFGGQ